VETDFIFSAIGEELGLVGAIGIILLYLLFAYRGFRIATKAGDDFRRLLATGLTSIFALQAFLIMGGVTKLIPLTGITLPFVSYGGSSNVANFVLVALLLRISDRSVVPDKAVDRAAPRSWRAGAGRRAT
jgi:cell division protein FtsW